jgi:hypothetical protein
MGIRTDPQAENLSFGELLTQEALYAEYQRLGAKLDHATEQLYSAGKDWAEKDDAYHRAKSTALVQVIGGKNQAEREAKVDHLFADERLQKNLSLALKEATSAQVMALRTQMSALQTLIAARRSELEATSYGQIGNK